jgi:hypothetical protein
VINDGLRVMDIWCTNILGIPLVSQRLLASQEGFGSKELVSHYRSKLGFHAKQFVASNTAEWLQDEEEPVLALALDPYLVSILSRPTEYYVQNEDTLKGIAGNCYVCVQVDQRSYFPNISLKKLRKTYAGITSSRLGNEPRNFRI